MAKSQETFNKKEKEKKRAKKRLEKQAKREARKAEPKVSGFENMIAYVDEFGQLTDTPPDPSKKIEIDVESIVIGATKHEEVEEVEIKHEGKIEFFNDSKGYGFIRENETNEKYFVHVNGLIDKVVEGDKVAYELEQGMKGINAVQVKKI
jgi:cold shock CspA family protein